MVHTGIGFINIAQGAKRTVFVGTFVSVGSRAPGRSPDRGRGRTRSSSPSQQVSFAPGGHPDTETGPDVTERAVLELTPDGPLLIEVAPGLDVERDVVAYMGWRPHISPDLRPMDIRCFADRPMGLRLSSQALLELDRDSIADGPREPGSSRRSVGI